LKPDCIYFVYKKIAIVVNTVAYTFSNIHMICTPELAVAAHVPPSLLARSMWCLNSLRAAVHQARERAQGKDGEEERGLMTRRYGEERTDIRELELM